MAISRKLIVPAVVVSSGILGLTACTGTTSNAAGTPTPIATASAPASTAPTPVSVQSSSAPSSSPSAAPQQAPVSAVIDDCSGKPVTQPSDIVLTCADAGWVLGHLTWTNWGHATATATGYWYEKDCKPNCATGTISHYPATVTVTKLDGTSYTHLSISAPTSPITKAAFSLRSSGPVFISKM